jgi:hypothetical protein
MEHEDDRKLHQEAIAAHLAGETEYYSCEFRLRQALISQKVSPALFSKGQSRLVDKHPISGTIITPKEYVRRCSYGCMLFSSRF